MSMNDSTHDHLNTSAPSLVDLVHLFSQLPLGMHYLDEGQLKGLLERTAHLLEMVWSRLFA